MSQLPEIIFASSNPSESRRIRNMLNHGQIRPLIPRAYTSNIEDPIDQIVRRNIWLLVSHIFPEAIISHRSAIEYRLSPSSNLYLTAGSRRVYRWPGVNIRIAEGMGPLSDDGSYMHNLRVSSLERACLENLSSSRMVDGEKRTVEQEVIEERLLTILNTRGEKALNQLRDRAREIAQELGMNKAIDKLNKIIGSILSTRPTKVLTSPRATAQAMGEPYDAERLDLFSILLAQLKQITFPERQGKTKSDQAFSNFAFFEAYFSNYIEGTTFLVDEAKQIVYDGNDIPLRIQDSHDIRGTYQIVSDRKEMSITPNTGNKLIDLLRERHAVVLGGRPEKNGGAFKARQNRAGNSVFVAPEFVIGTLKQGFALMASLDNPIARAIYMMFLISEVHPFDDGNGRVARIMMNAELVRRGSSKIIIPTVYRDDYILTLKRLTRQRDPVAFVGMMERASEFSHWLDPNNWDIMDKQLETANAYKEPDQDGTILNWAKE
jgi:hypothetical protein